ncbi:hypothetical protein CSV75_04495 [Sporosarcina sp. P18a]|uniref:hypothetical protein n=1 Tax=Sporosarcina sp. P18a TaxID=2048259 RepID=UPI000C16DC94|nr:hypothetical protein [Sporosarcina sp. P18a]PIC81044.1 hypothetical protein CSV75_04495 [Sporosarcina sp. P18a]
MSEMKQLPREHTIALVQELTDSHAHFAQEAEDAVSKQMELRERRNVLESAKSKTDSGMAQTIIESMVNELESEIEKEKERQRLSENNRGYYSEIKKAVEEALKEF